MKKFDIISLDIIEFLFKYSSLNYIPILFITLNFPLQYLYPSTSCIFFTNNQHLRICGSVDHFKICLDGLVKFYPFLILVVFFDLLVINLQLVPIQIWHKLHAYDSIDIL